MQEFSRGFLALLVLVAVGTPSRPAWGACECVVQVGNQNRRIWGSWALECNTHGGHGDCPKTNIDTSHSPGESAMTGRLTVRSRTGAVTHDTWRRTFSDDHITAFKGPVWDGGDWVWTNTCSCDGYLKKSCNGKPSSQWQHPDRRMYSGEQVDEQYILQGKSKTLRFPGSCGSEDQALVVEEFIQENDPWTPADPLGTLKVTVKPATGTRSHTIWAEHFEPAYDSSGKRTHAGYSGGWFGAEIVLDVTCRDVSR